MSTNKNQVAENNVTISPLAFVFEKCDLTPNTGNVIDILDLVQDIKIHESLNRSSIAAEIFINDAVNLIFELKLSGNEKINILISREEPENGRKKFELELYITDIVDYSEQTPSSRTYSIICMSKHNYLDKEKLLNIPFSGPSKKLIKDIVKKNLKSDIDTRCSTKNSMTGIYPNLSPMNAISWLLRNTFDDNTQCYFYESASEGLVLTSYKEIQSQKPHGEYNRVPYNTQTTYRSEPKEIFNEEKFKIRKFSSSLNLSKLDSAQDGAFGSTLNTIDIATKTTDKAEYKYGNKNLKLNTHPPITTDMKVDEQPLMDWKKYKQYFVSLNSESFGKKKNYHNPLNQTIMAANSHFENLDTVKMKITLAGDFDMAPGKIITIETPKQADISEELAEAEQYVDTFVTGNYLVSTITHHFSGNEGYQMYINLKKDSFVTEQVRK